MGRPFSIAPTEWPKIVKRAKTTKISGIAREYRVHPSVIYSIVRRGSLDAAQPANGGTTPTPAWLLTQQAARAIVVPQALEFIAALSRVTGEPTPEVRIQLRTSIDRLVVTLADLRAGLPE
jgi:hypothetical protein